jgi:hypothetical protein
MPKAPSEPLGKCSRVLALAVIWSGRFNEHNAQIFKPKYD